VRQPLEPGIRAGISLVKLFASGCLKKGAELVA